MIARIVSPNVFSLRHSNLMAGSVTVVLRTFALPFIVVCIIKRLPIFVLFESDILFSAQGTNFICAPPGHTGYASLLPCSSSTLAPKDSYNFFLAFRTWLLFGTKIMIAAGAHACLILLTSLGFRPTFALSSASFQSDGDMSRWYTF